MSSMDTAPRRPHILLGVTGSVAAVKAPEIALKLANKLDAYVYVLLTQGGDNFWRKAKDYNPLIWQLLQEEISIGQKDSPSVRVFAPDEEWKSWNVLGDPVLHIDLRDWADIVVIAPLSAHTLAKLANGLCNDTLTCVLRAWDLGHGTRPGKPGVIAPAMNTAMYNHPVTLKQMETLVGFWKDPSQCVSVAPITKTLACGEVGDGALAEVDTIVDAVRRQIENLKVYQ